MQNARSRLEHRLTQRLAASPPLARRQTENARVDLVYLDEETQEHLASGSPAE